MKFVWLQIAAALAVSVIAAWFSIVGMVAIFPGAVTAIIAMGVVLELAKIVTANALFRRWQTLNTLIKSYFVGAVLILSLITSLGIFGYLSKAHIEHSVVVGTTADAVSLVDNQLQTVQQSIASDRQVLKQMDDAVSALLADTSTVRKAVTLRGSQRAERKKLTDELTALNTEQFTLQSQRTAKVQTQRQVEIDVGPLKYLAQMLYGGDSVQSTDRAARLLIGVLITVFDPLALLLLVSANDERRTPAASEPPQPVREVQSQPLSAIADMAVDLGNPTASTEDLKVSLATTGIADDPAPKEQVVFRVG